MIKEELMVEIKESIATLIIKRPERKNALNLEMWRRIPEIIDQLEQNPLVKVIIIKGADETAFAAGADISEFTTIRSTPEGEAEYNETVLKAEASITNCSKPTIALIQGYCIGGGCIIALACDLRFSSDNGIFGVTPAKLGIIYTFSGTKNLVDLVGPSRAKDLLFSGRLIKAKEAFQIGLTDFVYAEDQIVEQTYNYAKTLTSLAQKTIKGAKKIIDDIKSGVSEETEEINEMIIASYGSSDYKEGVNAFLEKRKPKFSEI